MPVSPAYHSREPDIRQTLLRPEARSTTPQREQPSAA